MDDWKRILAESITKPKDLAKHLGVDPQRSGTGRGPVSHADHAHGPCHD